jgi:pimeloyl-ACP methyl ester carboxylesterase
MAEKKHIAFIHGFLESASMWQYILPHLSKSGYVIHLPELPGHGANNVLPTEQSAVTWCEDILQQINLPGRESLFIVAHSMGGYLAATLATMIPNHIRGLCFFQSKAGADNEEKITDRKRAILAAKENKNLYVRTMITNSFTPESRIRCKVQLEKMVVEAQQLELETIVAAQTVMINRPDRVNDMKLRNFPLYYFLGGRDPSLPMEVMNEELNQLPGAMTYVVQNIGHMGYVESNKEASEFLQRILRADV